MKRYTGGQAVQAGFYLDLRTWEVTSLSGRGGTLPGAAETRYLRVPLPLLLVFAPLMGLAYVVFLPLIGIVLVLHHVARSAAQRFSPRHESPRPAART
ncbi:MAG TPA: hypothetical protein VJS92_06980 [Candidatus Polarisedimenticolaceae bacterium]|nr:hypothetical protein [Candidatus Polarisedimenticolaceae bacterium]